VKLCLNNYGFIPFSIIEFVMFVYFQIFVIVIAGGSSNLGSAVATSMNLTNSSEPMGDNGPNGAYKMEGPHDMMYPYQVRVSRII
jgi:hypothetical protein